MLPNYPLPKASASSWFLPPTIEGIQPSAPRGSAVVIKQAIEFVNIFENTNVAMNSATVEHSPPTEQSKTPANEVIPAGNADANTAEHLSEEPAELLNIDAASEPNSAAMAVSEPRKAADQQALWFLNAEMILAAHVVSNSVQSDVVHPDPTNFHYPSKPGTHQGNVSQNTVNLVSDLKAGVVTASIQVVPVDGAPPVEATLKISSPLIFEPSLALSGSMMANRSNLNEAAFDTISIGPERTVGSLRSGVPITPESTQESSDSAGSPPPAFSRLPFVVEAIDGVAPNWIKYLESMEKLGDSAVHATTSHTADRATGMIVGSLIQSPLGQRIVQQKPELTRSADIQNPVDRTTPSEDGTAVRMPSEMTLLTGQSSLPSSSAGGFHKVVPINASPLIRFSEWAQQDIVPRAETYSRSQQNHGELLPLVSASQAAPALTKSGDLPAPQSIILQDYNLAFGLAPESITQGTKGDISMPEPGRPNPPLVAMQILDAAIRATTKPVDLVFDPKELGVVRISMTMADGAVNLTILAERQDTLDLARRHADQLAVELRDLGYGTVNFTFGQQGQFQENNQTEADPLGSREQIEPAQPPISKPIRTVGPHDATLDIRV